MRQRFTVASFNIHACVGRDRRRDVDRIAEVIRELNVDVIGLQEVDSRFGVDKEAMQMEYLARAAGLNAVAGPAIERHDRHYGNVILTNHPILEVRHLDLSVGNQEPRGAIDADIDIHGQRVRVVVTHFGLRRTERRDQTQRLLAALKARDAKQFTVVIGDFNEWLPKSRCLSWLQQRFGKPPAPATYPAFLPLFALDRVWVFPERALVDIHVHHTAITRVCSDHLPLKAIITMD